MPHQNRVSISELLSNLCTQEKQGFSWDAMTFTGAHVDTEPFFSRKPYLGISVREVCGCSWSNAIWEHVSSVGLHPLNMISSLKIISSIPWNYLISMRISNNWCCKDTFWWSISEWSNLSPSISILFHLHRTTNYSELEGMCKDHAPTLTWTWQFKKWFVWDTQSLTQLVSLFFWCYPPEWCRCPS